MGSRLAKFAVAALAIVMVLALGIFIGRRPPDSVPQTSASPSVKQAQAPAPQPAFADPYQRSAAIYQFKKAAASGPDRGREIFYYKCWFCHNEYAGPQSAPNPSDRISTQAIAVRTGQRSEDGIKEEIPRRRRKAWRPTNTR